MKLRCHFIRRWTPLVLGIVGWVIAGSLIADDSLQIEPTMEEIATPTASRMHSITGVASCAAASCHGGPKAGNYSVSSFAYTIWAADDKHARAHEVLFNDRSTRMAALLKLKQPAYLDQKCITCHTVQQAHTPTLKQTVLADGVGCESCHGSAGDWRDIHYLPQWQTYSKAERQERFGYQNLSDPLSRVSKCVECHVGSEGREVDHDMIAAGHPRLMFEFAAYQRLQPIHWNTRGKAEQQPDFSKRSWAVGQAVSLAAATRQLARRVEQPVRWPEFAEFNCYACHHDLKGGSWRQDPERLTTLSRQHRLGRPTWNTWFAIAPAVQTQVSDLQSSVDELGAAIQSAWPTTKAERLREISAVASRIAQNCDAAAIQLNDRTSATANSPDFLANFDPQKLDNWDATAQFYLAVMANRTHTHIGDASWDQRDRQLRELLAFPNHADSPRDTTPDDYREAVRSYLALPSHD